MDSLYIRLAAPIQSWAGIAVSGEDVRTQRLPTTSGLKGLVAGALGELRGSWPSWLDTIEFLVRQDRQPRLINDYQTINPPAPISRVFRGRLLLAFGMSERRANADENIIFSPMSGKNSTIIKRTYLADGEFLVRITAPGKEDELEDALSSPTFVTYLGRKAFAPDFPFYLGRGSSDAFTQIPALRLRGDAPDAEFKSLITVPRGANSSLLPPKAMVNVPVVATQKERLEKISELLDIRRPLNARA